ncbi:MAG: RNA-binding protein [Euryarchaeota archaeon]|nr:RNA-binding protein [Euryarchaeota archaeon]|tara:strand:- start:618 stop:935 length:318 start_codon:yes stop_codon:yes gene_type:complete
MPEPRIIYVGKKPSFSYIKAVLVAMKDGDRLIRLQARGQAIGRAVDVAEICRRRHGIIASMLPESVRIVNIETDSVELQDDDGRTKTVSSICIDLLGEGDMTEEE